MGKVTGTNILVLQDNNPDQKIGNIVVEHNKKYTRNMGVIIDMSIFCEKNTNFNIGDVVHFSDDAGVYLDKKNMKNMLLLDYREIVFITKTTNNEIFVGEDLRYYLEEDIANKNLEKNSNH